MSEASVTGDVYRRTVEGLHALRGEGYPMRGVRIVVSKAIFDALEVEARAIEMRFNGPLSPPMDGARTFGGFPLDRDDAFSALEVRLRYEVVV